MATRAHRYETLFALDQGSQGALSGWVFSFLHESFDVLHECFASSLNVWGTPQQTFNSLFVDVDRSIVYARIETVGESQSCMVS